MYRTFTALKKRNFKITGYTRTSTDGFPRTALRCPRAPRAAYECGRWQHDYYSRVSGLGRAESGRATPLPCRIKRPHKAVSPQPLRPTRVPARRPRNNAPRPRAPPPRPAITRLTCTRCHAPHLYLTSTCRPATWPGASPRRLAACPPPAAAYSRRRCASMPSCPSAVARCSRR